MSFDPSRYVYDSVTLEDADLSGQVLAPVELYDTTVRNLNLREAELRRWVFERCTIVDCDLSLCSLNGVVFQRVRFKRCKLVGVDWTTASLAGLDIGFEACSLRLTNLRALDLRRAEIRDCDLREADLTETDLTGADLRCSDMTGALTDRTILEDSDLRGVLGLNLDPERCQFRGARITAETAIQLARRLGLLVDDAPTR